MRAPLSIVIPTLNAEHALPACLGALMEGLEAGLIRELIIVDGGSTDQTCALAQEAGARVISAPASRGGQLRAGCDAARGDWLLVLHADTRLQAGWAREVQRHITTRPDRAGYGRLRFDARGFGAWWVARWANWRARMIALPYGDQGLLIPRALYQDIGGYSDMPLMEDVDIARKLRGLLVALPIIATTDFTRYARDGWVWRGGRNLWTLARYALGASPATLAQSYARSRRSPRK